MQGPPPFEQREDPTKRCSNEILPNRVSPPTPPQANGRIVGTIFRLYLDRFCTLEFLQDLKKCIESINKARTGPKQDILKHWLVPQKHLDTHQYNKALSLNGSLFRDPGPYRDNIIYIYIYWVPIYFSESLFSVLISQKNVSLYQTLGVPISFKDSE